MNKLQEKQSLKNPEINVLVTNDSGIYYGYSYPNETKVAGLAYHDKLDDSITTGPQMVKGIFELPATWFEKEYPDDQEHDLLEEVALDIAKHFHFVQDEIEYVRCFYTFNDAIKFFRHHKLPAMFFTVQTWNSDFGYCPRCGDQIELEMNSELGKEYPYQCKKCDENFFTFEITEGNSIALEKWLNSYHMDERHTEVVRNAVKVILLSYFNNSKVHEYSIEKLIKLLLEPALKHLYKPNIKPHDLMKLAPGTPEFKKMTNGAEESFTRFKGEVKRTQRHLSTVLSSVLATERAERAGVING